MRARSRLLAGLVAVLAVFAMATLTADAAEAETGAADKATISASIASSGISAMARQVRPRIDLRVVVNAVPGTAAALAAGLLAVGVRLRATRRIGDQGDAWRSLLLGAPPA